MLRTPQYREFVNQLQKRYSVRVSSAEELETLLDELLRQSITEYDFYHLLRALSHQNEHLFRRISLEYLPAILYKLEGEKVVRACPLSEDALWYLLRAVDRDLLVPIVQHQNVSHDFVVQAVAESVRVEAVRAIVALRPELLLTEKLKRLLRYESL